MKIVNTIVLNGSPYLVCTGNGIEKDFHCKRINVGGRILDVENAGMVYGCFSDGMMAILKPNKLLEPITDKDFSIVA